MLITVSCKGPFGNVKAILFGWIWINIDRDIITFAGFHQSKAIRIGILRTQIDVDSNLERITTLQPNQ